MKMRDVNMPAVRAYLRAIRPVNEAYMEAAACERKFDGGEWSDAASAAALDDAEQAMAAKIAPVFGLEVEDLLDMVLVVAHHGNQMWIESMQRFVRDSIQKHGGSAHG